MFSREIQIRAEEGKGCGRFSWQAGLKLPCGEAPLRLLPFLGSTTENVRDLPVSDSSRICANAATTSYASLHDNRFLNGILRHASQTIFAPIFKNQGNGLR
jgi:hypothetical protein